MQDTSAQDAPTHPAIPDSTLQRLDCLLGGTAYARERPWFALDSTRFFGKRYVKFAPPRIYDLALFNKDSYRIGTHADGQVAVYANRERNGDMEPPQVLFVPVAAGCLIQAYQRHARCRGYRCEDIP